MNATRSLDSPILRKNSVLFWCTLVVPAGIIALGINFILNPVGASTGYGIPIRDPAAFPFMWITGIRDIFAGLVILPFLWRGRPARNRNTLRYFNFRPVLRWACHSATSWLCAACLYSLGNSAVHDDCCRISS